MRSPTPRRPSVAALAAFVLLAAPLGAQGVGFTMRSSTLDDGKATATTTTRVRTRGAVMRFEGVAEAGQSKNEFGDDAYTLVDAGNRRIQVVMPGLKQYWELKFDDSTATAIKTAASVSTAIADLKVSGQSLGGGERVNGQPTSRYRLTTDFSEITGGEQRPRHMHVVEEYWVADALRDVADPLEQLGRTLGGKGGFTKSPYGAVGASSVNDLLARRMAEQQRMFKGFPVKTVTTAEETQTDGSVVKSVHVTELADVQRGDFDAALFRVPDGYTPFDPRAVLGNMNAQLKEDAKEGAKEAAKDGAKDGAKDAVKGALGGFLKRKKP